MSQRVSRITPEGHVRFLSIPAASERVLGNVRWGRFTQPHTPAYWRALAWLHSEENRDARFIDERNGIVEETVYCLLGGYGIRAEVAHAYFLKCRAEGIFYRANISEREIRNLLASPVRVADRMVRYRFPNQKARYIAATLRTLAQNDMPKGDVELRDWLLGLPGIGWKTAGWIVRNCLSSDNVAIIDVHLLRAGQMMRIFDTRSLSHGNYAYFEVRFLQFARALGVKASSLDLLMWETMRTAGLRNRVVGV